MILSPRTAPRLLDDRSKLDQLRTRNVCRLEAVREQSSELPGFVLGAGFGSLAQSEAVSGGGDNQVAEPNVAAGRGSNSERGGVLGALAPPFNGTGGSRIAGVILVLLLVPALVLLSIAAMPRTALLRGPTEVLARRQDDLLLLGLLWVLVWGLYVALVYVVSVVI